MRGAQIKFTFFFEIIQMVDVYCFLKTICANIDVALTESSYPTACLLYLPCIQLILNSQGIGDSFLEWFNPHETSQYEIRLIHSG